MRDKLRRKWTGPFEHFIDYLTEIMSITSSPTPTCIKSWAELRGIPLSSWEASTIMKMTAAFRRMLQTGKDHYDPMLEEHEIAAIKLAEFDNDLGKTNGRSGNTSGQGRLTRAK